MILVDELKRKKKKMFIGETNVDLPSPFYIGLTPYDLVYHTIHKVIVSFFLGDVVALKRAVCILYAVHGFYARSPRIRRASWISLGMMVTLLAWMAHKLVSSNRPTR